MIVSEYNAETGETRTYDDGITPAPWVREYPQISARQLRLALLSLGIQEADVDMLLVNDPEGMVEWKHASYYKRSHPLVDGLAASFSITPEQINDLWLWASEI